jgi:CDP-glucose 4,6-dehydratase
LILAEKLYCDGSKFDQGWNFGPLDQDARTVLGWAPKWNVDMALDKVIEWTEGYQKGENILKISVINR